MSAECIGGPRDGDWIPTNDGRAFVLRQVVRDPAGGYGQREIGAYVIVARPDGQFVAQWEPAP